MPQSNDRREKEVETDVEVLPSSRSNLTSGGCVTSETDTVFLPPRTITMKFLYACHLVLNLPSQRQTVPRDYVAHVFNGGTIFSPGIDVNKELKPLLSPGITVECTFHHNDKTRKSYNFVEIVYSARDHGQGYIAKTVTKTFKPQSAEMTFQAMLQNKHFFIQGCLEYFEMVSF